jgi:hypothetical protein
MAREFVCLTIGDEQAEQAFQSESDCRAILGALDPDPEHFFWFEYNFLYVLAADGSADKTALGNHKPAGYRQRSRFYEISDEGRLLYSQGVAKYILFLAENTGIALPETCRTAREELDSCKSMQSFLDGISGR